MQTHLFRPQIIRIKHDATRIALSILFAPLWWLVTIIEWSMPERWGGHPNGWRIFSPEAWGFLFDVWWVGAAGYFVDCPIATESEWPDTE